MSNQDADYSFAIQTNDPSFLPKIMRNPPVARAMTMRADRIFDAFMDVEEVQKWRGERGRNILQALVNDHKTTDFHLKAASKRIDVNTKDNDGYTALHTAAYLNTDNLIRVLELPGVDINARSHTGESALHCAAQACQEENLDGQNKTIFGFLLGWKPDTQGLDRMNLLIDAGIDITIEDENGQTAMDWIRHIDWPQAQEVVARCDKLMIQQGLEQHLKPTEACMAFNEGNGSYTQEQPQRRRRVM